MQDPCNPSPCGPNSQCKVNNGGVSCQCLPYFVGQAPYCRPECVTNSECSLNKACENNKCIDPCENSCGIDTVCTVRYHFPICRCKNGFTGNPLSSCFEIRRIPENIPSTQISPVVVESPTCYPNPCGPYSYCRVNNEILRCSCLENHIGNPPNCRPECINNNDCANDKACQNNLCRNPCEGACGSGAQCHVTYHKAACFCHQGLIGDPYRQCYAVTNPGKMWQTLAILNLL